MSISKAIDTIHRCEAELQELLRNAACERDYEAAIQLGEWARRVALVLDGVPANQRPNEVPADPPSTAGGSEERHVATTDGLHAAVSSSRVRAPQRGSKKRVRRKPSDGYPRFSRQNDQLVKTGWSRKQKREYQHKAPKAVVELLASVLASLPGPRLTATTDDIFPLLEADGTEVPSYQSYLCLAWMRHVGLIVQEGRQGYHVPKPSTLMSDAAGKWDELPVM